ncbi:Golgi to ER traffic protein 4-like protein [Senna tora]|uniref:Golgi to ER traffic protein 4-like protein n=1 Tax=Senna tora TaxID=362788 RepID=A0A834W6N7_9FABA|nr:Golgi to ER traffic protein 4-like protein [Senna tora]
MTDAIAEKFYGVQRRSAMGIFEDIFKSMGKLQDSAPPIRPQQRRIELTLHDSMHNPY